MLKVIIILANTVTSNFLLGLKPLDQSKHFFQVKAYYFLVPFTKLRMLHSSFLRPINILLYEVAYS